MDDSHCFHFTFRKHVLKYVYVEKPSETRSGPLQKLQSHLCVGFPHLGWFFDLIYLSSSTEDISWKNLCHLPPNFYDADHNEVRIHTHRDTSRRIEEFELLHHPEGIL